MGNSAGGPLNVLGASARRVGIAKNRRLGCRDNRGGDSRKNGAHIQFGSGAGDNCRGQPEFKSGQGAEGDRAARPEPLCAHVPGDMTYG